MPNGVKADIFFFHPIDFFFKKLFEDFHQGADFPVRPIPVFIGKGKEGEGFNVEIPAERNNAVHDFDPLPMTIQPWDASILKDIEKAVLASDLGLTPNNDGKMVRLAIPPLTSDRRKQLGKVVKKHAEECKVAIRNIRREFNDSLKSKEKKHEVSEDECHGGLDSMQKITDKMISEVDKIAQVKEKDILEV